MAVLQEDRPSRPLRLLLVAPSMEIVGGQSVQADLIRRHLDEEDEVEIEFQPINPRLPMFLRPLHKVRFARTFPTFALYCWQLWTGVRRCDVLHVFSASYLSFLLAPTPAILLARVLGKPIVLNYHSGEAEDHLSRWPLAVKTLRLADKIVVPSKFLVDVFRRFGLNATPIFNAVDLSAFRFRRRERPGPRFLSNRNFESHYNVSCVLEAFGMIQAQFPEASLTVAGDGPLREILRDQAKRLALSHVRFTGRVEPAAMPALYDEHDVWLNASNIDNMPLSILEAFASGVAVVSTDAGGIPFVVEDGRNGRLVPCGEPDALAAAAIEMIRDPGQFARLTGAALAQCSSYQWTAVRSDWMTTYRELAARGGRDVSSARS